MKKYDCIVIGAGLAGLTTAYSLVKNNKKVLLIEKEKYFGGRTSSWNDNGFLVEAGFHRHIGFYHELPKLLKEVGVNLDDIIMWEKEVEIIINKHKRIILGISPFYHPITFLKDITGNKECLTTKDKMSLVKLFLIGFKDYTINPQELDNYSILDYCQELNISKRVIEDIVTSLSTGIFFLPKEKYTAKLFFGLFYPSLYHPINLRIGAYKGGMSEVIAKPLATKIKELGGEIILNTRVEKIYLKNKTWCVLTNKEMQTDYLVLATDILNAKQLVSNLNSKEIKKIKKMPTTSAITVQLELSKPMMPIDRTTFTTSTILASFTEESRSTFPNSKGRISIILANPDNYIKLTDKEILNKVLRDLEKLNFLIKDTLLDYRIVRHENKFYGFSPNNDYLRPNTDSGIKGLVLAGDYTKQKMYATMEGAVISGLKATKFILDN